MHYELSGMEPGFRCYFDEEGTALKQGANAPNRGEMGCSETFVLVIFGKFKLSSNFCLKKLASK